MGQRRNGAALKVALFKLSKEECALGMGQRESANTRDAPIML